MTMIINPIGWAGTVYLLFPARTLLQPRAEEVLALDLTKCVLRIARPRRSFLFSSFPILTVSPSPWTSLGFLGHHWRRAKGEVTLGDIPSLRGLARPVPQFPGVQASPAPASLLLASLSPCQGVKRLWV